MIYIVWNDVILELTVTTSIDIIETSDVTKHPMESGSIISDNVVNRNTQYTIRGLLTEIKSYIITVPEPQEDQRDKFKFSGQGKQNQKSVTDYFSEMKRMRDSKDLVTFFFDNRLHGDGIDNCIVTSLRYDRDPSIGNAYRVEIGLEQVRVSDRAEITARREIKNENLNGEETEGSSTPTQEVEVVTESLATSIVEGVRNLLSSNSNTEVLPINPPSNR